MDIPVQVKVEVSKIKQVIAMNSFLLKVRNPFYFIQWNLSFGTLLFRDTKFGPEKMFTLYLYLLPIEGTPLFRGKVPWARFNFHPGDTLALKMWLTTKRVDNCMYSVMCMLSFNFILGFNFIFLCFKLIIIHYHTPKQREIICKPRIILNHNMYT